MPAFVTDVLNTLFPSGIDDFKAVVSAHSGLAKSDRFIIMMRPPSEALFRFDLQDLAIKALGQGTSEIGLRDFVNDPRDLALLCESTSLPGRQIQTIENAQVTNPRKVATGYFNEDVTCTFLLTGDYYVKKFFDIWNKAIIDKDFYHLKYDNNFKTDIIIQQLDHQNLPIYSVRLRNAWPMSVNSVELNNANGDYERLNVVFTYDDFIEEPVISSTASAVASIAGGLLTKLV